MKNLILIIAASLVSFSTLAQLPKEFLDEVDKNDFLMEIDTSSGSDHNFYVFFSYINRPGSDRIEQVESFFNQSEEVLSKLGINVAFESELVDGALVIDDLYSLSGDSLEDTEGGDGTILTYFTSDELPEKLDVNRIVIYIHPDNRLAMYIVKN